MLDLVVIQILRAVDNYITLDEFTIGDSQYNTAVINKGTITTLKEYSLGLYASDKSVLTNEEEGEIYINGINSVAIYTAGRSNITNNGYITLGTTSSPLVNSFGIFSKGDSVIQ